jgi:translation initiation factor IF-2
MENGLMSEDWGGKTIMLGVSAKTGKGIDELLEMLVLESDLLELKADPTTDATGIVVEAELSKGSGVLATVLVQDGTLRVGDTVIVGDQYGKVRAMINDRGQRIKEAPPSTPVEILGLPSVPKAGDHFKVMKDERAAKELLEQRQASGQSKAPAVHVTLEHLLEDIKAGKAEELKLILKSDVQGSVEALRNTLGTIKSKNVRLNIIHTGVGEVSESDVLLAAASNAVVIGFHVGIATAASETAEKEQVDVRFYEIIYEVKTAIEKSMEGLLSPEEKEVFVGVAEVRQVFKVSKVGAIAGCSVQKGKIVRNHSCRVVRGGVKIHEGKVSSLKRFKDDAREVLEGFECGIGVSGFDDLVAGDRIEVFEIQKKARKLE